MTTESTEYIRSNHLPKAGTSKIGQPMNDAQRLASVENFAIFTLKGRSMQPFLKVLPAHMIRELQRLQNEAIEYIKNVQQERKDAKK